MTSHGTALAPDASPTGWVRCPESVGEQIRRAAQDVAAWLARRDVSSQAEVGNLDLIIVAGSAVLQSCQVAAAAWQARPQSTVLLTGGHGHSTADLRDILERALPIAPFGLAKASEAELLVQDPTMARPTHATFTRAWRHRPATLISFAPFVPSIADTAPGSPTWTWPRFVSLLIGELSRLTDDEHGYGPAGRTTSTLSNCPRRSRQLPAHCAPPTPTWPDDHLHPRRRRTTLPAMTMQTVRRRPGSAHVRRSRFRVPEGCRRNRAC